jgi:hypothetical protein
MAGLAVTLTAVALGLGGTAPGAGGVHPFHVTLAEAEFNPETRRLEVALRVYHPLDLETALTRLAGRKVTLDGTADVDELIAAYLDEAFVVERPDGTRAALEWVGKEVTLKTAWLYFEVDLPGGPEGCTFADRVLFEVEPDQANTIVFRDGRRRASLRCTREADRRVFVWSENAP